MNSQAGAWELELVVCNFQSGAWELENNKKKKGKR